MSARDDALRLATTIEHEGPVCVSGEIVATLRALAAENERLRGHVREMHETGLWDQTDVEKLLAE